MPEQHDAPDRLEFSGFTATFQPYLSARFEVRLSRLCHLPLAQRASVVAPLAIPKISWRIH